MEAELHESASVHADLDDSLAFGSDGTAVRAGSDGEPLAARKRASVPAVSRLSMDADAFYLAWTK
mgnify:CR=1 FL=1